MASQLRLIVSVVLILLLAGCFVKPEVLTPEEIQTRANRDLDIFMKDQEPVTGPIDLYQAVARALKYNLEVRVEVMEEMLAHQQLDTAHYSMLPRMVATARFDERSNFSGGTSISLLTGQESLEASTSSEKDVLQSDLTLTWDMLDFGLSYIRAKQVSDDVLIAEEEKRRVGARVVRDVRRAYWRALSAERMLKQLDALERWITKALETSMTVQREGLESPLQPLQYQRELINSQREIQKLYRQLATAKMELAKLMNLPPGSTFDLAGPEKILVPQLQLPLEQMEFTALLNRPELRVLDYRRRINSRETKAALLELLPNLNIEWGGTYNSNKLLFNSNWLAYGAKVSWNLMNVFRQPQRLKAIDMQKQVLSTQSLALTMAVLTQVHVSMAQFTYSKKEFLTAKRYYETQSQIAEQVQHFWRSDQMSEQEVIRERVNLVLAQLRYFSAQADLQSAYANVLAAMGEDFLPEHLSSPDVAELSAALRVRWENAQSRAKKIEPKA